MYNFDINITLLRTLKNVWCSCLSYNYVFNNTIFFLMILVSNTQTFYRAHGFVNGDLDVRDERIAHSIGRRIRLTWPNVASLLTVLDTYAGSSPASSRTITWPSLVSWTRCLPDTDGGLSRRPVALDVRVGGFSGADFPEHLQGLPAGPAENRCLVIESGSSDTSHTFKR